MNMVHFNLSLVLAVSMSLFAVSGISGCGSAKPLPACDPGVDCIYSFTCDNSGNYYFDSAYGVVTKFDIPHYDVCKIIDPDVTGWEDLVKDACTGRCEVLDNDLVDNSMYPEVCVNANWSAVNVNLDSAGAYLRCPNETMTMLFDDVGVALGALAQSYAETLPCDLGDNCMDFLSQKAKRGFTHPQMPSIETTADIQMVNDPGFTSTVTLEGTTATVTGAAAYSTTSCAEDACPFYLAQLDLAPTSSITVTVSFRGTTLQKVLSNVNVSLARTTMGMWLPSTGDVIFPPGSLHLRIASDVSGSPQPFNENGSYDVVYTITHFVFGTLDSGVLSIAHSDEDELGDWSFEAQFVPN